MRQDVSRGGLGDGHTRICNLRDVRKIKCGGQEKDKDGDGDVNPLHIVKSFFIAKLEKNV